MNLILLRYVGYILMAAIAGAGGGYLAVNNKTASPPATTQSRAIPAVPAQPFPGQKIPAIPARPALPQPRQACTKSPQLSQLSSLDSSWSMKNPQPVIDNYYTYLYGVETMLKSRSGVLFSAGYKSSSSGYLPVMNRSTDNGTSWRSIEMPIHELTPYLSTWDMIYSMAEDKNGIIYAGGTGLWKSSDGGNTWVALPMPYMDTYWGTFIPVYSMFIAKDDALIAVFNDNASGPSYDPPSSRVAKSVDGGNTWSEILSGNYAINSVTEADDGSLVFREYYSYYRPSGGGIYRYSNGVITQTFIDYFSGLADYNAELLKSSDGALYFVSVDTAVDLNTIDYTQPGHALLAAYKSTDNGNTWKKLGALPDSWSIQGPVIETADGVLYVASFSVCNESDSIYKSTDKGATWSVIAASPKFGSNKPADKYYYFRIVSLVEAVGKVLIGGNAPLIFTTK